MLSCFFAIFFVSLFVLTVPDFAAALESLRERGPACELLGCLLFLLREAESPSLLFDRNGMSYLFNPRDLGVV